jgi:hypothetical protein
MKTSLIFLALAFASPAFASTTIPENEPEFVSAIQSLHQDQIVEALGDPAFQYDIRDDAGEVVGSIWHYHNVTLGEDGQYYKTTELDIVDKKVVTVVLINSDATDAEPDQAYMPEPEPENTF